MWGLNYKSQSLDARHWALFKHWLWRWFFSGVEVCFCKLKAGLMSCSCWNLHQQLMALFAFATWDHSKLLRPLFIHLEHNIFYKQLNKQASKQAIKVTNKQYHFLQDFAFLIQFLNKLRGRLYFVQILSNIPVIILCINHENETHHIQFSVVIFRPKHKWIFI